jgi:putative transposase
VPSWHVSISTNTDFCQEVVRHAANIDIDQGSQFTSAVFIGLLKHREIRIMMDGKGNWRDDIFVERLWNSVKTARAAASVQQPAPHLSPVSRSYPRALS